MNGTQIAAQSQGQNLDSARILGLISEILATTGDPALRRRARDFSRGGTLTPELVIVLLLFMSGDGNRRGYRHILDSLLIAEFIPQGSCVLDIGTGPGFPAWPLALARPDLTVTAMDSSGKMLGFLRRHLLPNLSIEQGRAEELGLPEAFDVVTGRALAPLAIQLELSARPCRTGGIVLPMRTANDLPEIERLSEVLGLELEEVHRRTLPVIDAERVFPVYRKVHKTPHGHPRPWAKMRERAL